MSDLELTMMRRVGELNKENAALKAENARLKTEVEHLMVFCNCTLIPNKELQAQVERLTEAGDAMAKLMFIDNDYIGSPKQEAVVEWCKATDAKEGKGQP
jgi:regulator of replication initiation timing